MSDVVIRAEGLSKKYIIGHEPAERYTALRDVLAQRARGLARSARYLIAGRPLIVGQEQEEFWALRDINFEIRRSEVVGIIGRNGAGKSTLLKVLSRITEPTEGRVVIDGRVASLLEVGTGFHPELTGRENIYLNGAILGMTRAEILRKFDEIVDFAGVERFLDTPVKRYSSGMYVRLAFSVAAHLEPEILVVDEVLAVGDAEFQKKCLGKMQDVAGGGRTVLFVSHNMAAVQRLCPRAIYLKNGALQCAGPSDALIQKYHAETAAAPTQPDRVKSRKSYYFEKLEILVSGEPTSTVRTWDDAEFVLRFHSPIAIRNGSVTFEIRSADGTKVFFTSSQPDCDFGMTFEEGRNDVTISVPRIPLSSGSYAVICALAIPNVEWLLKPEIIAGFEVIPTDVYESGMGPSWARNGIALSHSWSCSSPKQLTGDPT